jgi:hypothetical protein
LCAIAYHYYMTIDPAGKAVDTADAVDRRRPGRRTDATPELIELLRGASGGRSFAPDENNQAYPLSAARGVVVGVLLSAIFWTLAGTVVFVFVK